MPMVKDYLHNKFKHGIKSGIFQYGVGQETTSAEVAEILATFKKSAFCLRLKAFEAWKI